MADAASPLPAAEGKLSAWVLGLLPPLFMVYLLLTNYDYVSVMFTEGCSFGLTTIRVSRYPALL